MPVVHLVRLVPEDRREHRVLLVLQGLREHPGQLVLSEPLVRSEPQDLKALLEPPVVVERQVGLELQVLKDR